MTGNLLVRILAVPVLVGAIVTILLPRMTGFEANYAVINAPVLSVTAPFDGTILRASSALARPINPGETLLDLESSRVSEAEIDRVEARQQTLSKQLDAVEAEIVRLSALEAKLVERQKMEKHHALKRINARISVLTSDLEAASARVAHLAQQLSKAERLSEQGALPAAKLDDLRFELVEAKHHKERSQFALAAESLALATVHSINALDSSDLAAYTRQRLDEIEIRHSDLRTRRAFIAADLAAVTSLLQATKDESHRLQHFSPVAPAPGVVWKPSRSARTPVSTGQEVMQLLDCSRRYIEVNINERYFDKIEAGSEAIVRLRGGSETFTAGVVSLRGSSERVAEAELSAISRSEVLSELTLYIDIAAADPSDPEVAAAFCDVGRSAEVWFRRPSSTAVDQFVEKAHTWINKKLGYNAQADLRPAPNDL